MNAPWTYRLADLRKRYADGFALDVPELTVAPGEILGLLGPTGSGKSTLLRLLAGLEPPSAGRLWYGEQPLNGRTIPLAIQRRITMVFQRPLVLSGTVRWNVEYGLRLRGQRQRAAKVEEVLRRLRLTELAARSARTLSGGQCQLVALARALVIEPDVLLLDEPTANLDPAHVALVEEAIAAVHQQHKTTIVWATHNLFQAKRMAHRVALLLEGQLVEVAPTPVFFESPKDPRTEAFVQGKIPY